MSARRSFSQFLAHGCEQGGFETDDVLAAMLPLMEQARDAHERDLVALVDGVEGVWEEGGRLGVDAARLQAPRKNSSKIAGMQKPLSEALQIVGKTQHVADLDEGSLHLKNMLIGQADQPLVTPVYLPGYLSWEDRLEHHDQLTDIFCLGLMMASLACRLELTDAEDLELLANNRGNLFALNPRLNPVLAGAIVRMTELDRARRAQDLRSLVERLKNYREQVPESLLEFNGVKGFRDGTQTEKRRIIQGHLRNRLFEISRRNRLIYFRPTLQTLNLTLASVPLMLDYRNIRADQLFIWQESLAGEISKGNTIALGNYLRFEDAPYVSGVLDQIMNEARRDRAEYGFAQLRLVLCFLRWNNLKESPDERIHSPLLLLPVELVKKKGVRDSYQLKPSGVEAEVNPALRHHLQQLYGLKLPAAVDLSEGTLDAFCDILRAQIQASEPGVSLEKIEKPRIRLIHEKARQRLDQYRRRLRRGAGNAGQFEKMNYSYQRDNLQPLGLQIFHGKICVPRAPLSDAVGKKVASRAPGIVEDAGDSGGKGAISEKENQMYSLEEPGSSNRYQWEFDLCSLTLGNFNYRKMSLVQDYSKLIEGDFENRVFDSVFTLQPRSADAEKIVLPPMEEQFPVVAYDPTQAMAISRARTGGSYIIQGPPGTGKSQTITNLIADYVARGKRVLFVCEKRAAIDVVYHRLRQQGLADLCCLIHDSQSDKKAFIQDLKQTYESFLKETSEQVDPKRKEMIRSMEEELGGLARFSEIMGRSFPQAGIRLRELLHRLIELRPHEKELTPLELERIPDYILWFKHGTVLSRLEKTLREMGLETLFSRNPFRHLSREVIQSSSPMARITSGVEKARGILSQVEDSMMRASLPAESREQLGQIESLLVFAQTILPLATWNLLFLLNPGHERAKEFGRRVRKLVMLEKTLAESRKITTGWKEKLPAREVASALEQSRVFAHSWFAFLNPSWWRLRKILNQRYDFNAHVVKPGWVQVLTELEAEFKALDAHEDALRQLQEDFEIPDARACLEFMAGLPGILEKLSPSARALVDQLSLKPAETRLVSDLASMLDTFRQLDAELSSFLTDYRDQSVSELRSHLGEIGGRLGLLPELTPVLADVLELPLELGQAIRRFPLTQVQLESAMARKSLASIYSHEREVSTVNGPRLEKRLERFEKHQRDWLKLNAEWICERVRGNFREHVRISTLPASQLIPGQKLFKKSYATGRRELEHEFAKTMRYRSIRDLADDETGLVLRDLKPVWLMSPLSVSDTIPLSSEAFDVVIFDEASQIPVEEAVPAVYRAQQTIVVGDEMQLPPTSFFSAVRTDDENLTFEEEGEKISYDLDADSFLTQSARNLPSTLLGWHYRSRHESLISFSNAAFYQGKLLTVPDLWAQGGTRDGIRVAGPELGEANVAQLLDRSLSFHFMENGVYDNRCNTSEARYIARLVRGLFRREVRHSIGIVAFSEAQQGEIEEALKQLGEEDHEFRNRLETEFEREEENQFCGLFVKNLENVQGDERDIIILSICYGYDRNKKMLMNFGPINQRGGEKRLNVIFSRAKHRMAVVSSIHHFDITNEYNDGANCLRNFLEYAASSSSGDFATANRVLASWGREKGRPGGATSLNAVISEVAQALRERGHAVAMNVGQSEFRCPVAVVDPSSGSYRLGILVDDSDREPRSDLENYVLRPGVLRAFGWKTTFVLTKDWYHHRDAVVERLERLIRNEAEDSPAVEEEVSIESGDNGNSVPEVPNVAIAPMEKVEIPIASPPLAATEKSSAEITTGKTRYFEFADDKSNKFWEVAVNANVFVIRFGRIGTTGQSQEKTLPSAVDAEREVGRLIREKLGKGYVERPG